MLPCLRAGTDSRFVASIRRDFTRRGRVSAGSIVFHIDDDDVELRVGDRLDLEPGTEHAATVGPDGVECVEASR